VIGGRLITPITYYSNIYRLDFSNDLMSWNLRAYASGIPTSAGGSYGNSSYGWWYVSSGIHLRMDYSNDTTIPTTRGSGVLLASAGVSNSLYGWQAGGSGPLSSVSRFDFSNDLSSTTSKGPLTVARYGPTGVSNYVK
jgi:hypothetical protein